MWNKSQVCKYNGLARDSIVMQALVDSKYLFRDVVIGWPGSVHDARVLSNSELFNRGCNGQLFDPSIKESILGVDMGPFRAVNKF